VEAPGSVFNETAVRVASVRRFGKGVSVIPRPS
jgi:hypothetical protein